MIEWNLGILKFFLVYPDGNYVFVATPNAFLMPLNVSWNNWKSTLSLD